MSSTLPLSVVVITKNEAHRLADCLESVKWAGEIVVVDDESTDETVAVARRTTDRVLSRRMEMEGIHRNWAYAQAKNDWVFSLDADERVTPELADEIEGLLKGNPASDVYSVPRRNYIGRHWIRHGGWYPSAQVKLFRRAMFQWEETTVHPRAITRSDKPWGTLKNDLIHYSYRDFSDFIQKLNRQTTLEAQKWIQDGRRVTWAKALWRSLDRFVRSYWAKRGTRDGFIGFFCAVCAGMYQFLSFAKYWQSTVHSEFIEGRRPAQGERREGATLSAVILTRNAAGTIERCLRSVSWVDEVIVVDGGSTDGTLNLCERAGARVLSRAPTENFSQERNAGSQVAKGAWILQLDADEEVTPEFRKALQQILLGENSFAAYKFRRLNYFLGRRMRFGGWDHHSLHLFRKGLAWYEGRVHERLHVNGPIGVLDVGVVHYPFQSLEQFLDRQNRYTGLEALDLVKQRGPVSHREFRFQAVVKPVKLFLKMYVKKQGFREGMHGIVFSTLFAFVHFLKWAKVWELMEE